MSGTSPRSINREAVLPEVIAVYGKLKRIRYLINSTPDFHEVLFAVNQIVGAVGSVAEAEKIMQLVAFNTVPLPNSQARFLACFDVPERLLGESRSRAIQLPDYSSISLPEGALQVQCQNAQTIFKYRVDTLFDLNLALKHFEIAKPDATPQAVWKKIRRNFDLSVVPRKSSDSLVDLLIAFDLSEISPQPA